MTYRLLNNSEIIKTGDEVLLEDGETWESLPTGKGETVGETWMIGMKYNRGFLLPIRRLEEK